MTGHDRFCKFGRSKKFCRKDEQDVLEPFISHKKALQLKHITLMFNIGKHVEFGREYFDCSKSLFCQRQVESLVLLCM